MAWTSPRTWVAGEKPSATTYNTHVRDNFKAIGDAWTSYAGSIATTNITVGNGTLLAVYMQAGKLVHYRIKFTLGSTSAITGSPTFTLPVAAIAARAAIGLVTMYDSSAGTSGYFGGWAFNNSTTVLLTRTDASANLSATVPFTWATSDELIVTGTYEAA